MATNQIRQLFNLPKSENIFDDFACSYNSFPGRVYLSQSYLCFYSTMLGKTTKLILSYDQITKVYKSNNKFSKSIKVHKQVQRAKQAVKNEQAKKEPEEKDKEEIYRFYSFKERDFTFKYIRRLWANSSPHAGSEDDESENSEEEKKAPAQAANEKEEKAEKKISLEKVENRSNADGRPGVSVSNS